MGKRRRRLEKRLVATAELESAYVISLPRIEHGNMNLAV